MLELIRCLVASLFPSRGTHRAEDMSTAECQRAPWPPLPAPLRPADVICVDALPIVPRYFVEFENERERRRQRERRTALASTSVGSDMPECAA